MGAKSGRNKRGANPGKGKAPGGKTGRGSGSSASQRLGLVLFAIVFVALFVIFAVSEGLGAPSVPSGDIAVVSNVPSDLGHISEADYKRSYAQQVAQAGVKKAPKAGSTKAEELHKTTVAELLNTAWITGEGEELGIKITNKEVETELAKIKKESFKTEKAFQEFLKEDHFNEEDVNQRIELQILSTKIQEKITKEAPPVSEAELKAYYEAEKAAQYTKKPTRDVRVVVNENKKEVEAAQKALEADNSEASWKKVTKKYSPTTATNGGLQKEIAEEFLTEPLKKDIFKSATGELIGPVKQEKNYLLLEVVKLHPEKTQPFAEVKSTISTTLTQQKQEKYFSTWVAGFQSKWSSRSQCASGFVVEQCANYKGSAHPSTASAACYEANPKTPATECPAPVTQNTPAVPGTMTVAKPEGERLVQRPHPEALSKKAKEEAAAAAGTAGGAEGAPTEGAEGSAETEAAIKAAEEAAAKAAAEGEK
ncbi:MAG TPA: peptidyl-prolyl cis-trans isomerase [Solirubrobacterales bacterium]|nr:peptidyl-prolyl cis-trans isomerase [Solirubrobacterales bacterium]